MVQVLNPAVTPMSYSHTQGGEAIETEKAVDITEGCPALATRGPILMLFGRTQDRVMVEIQDRGGTFACFVDSVEALSRSDHGNWVKATAQMLGLTPGELASLVHSHAPTQ